MRSRHGLVYDKSQQAAVLFGGMVWGPRPGMKSDTWELHGLQWFQIDQPESPPARHRGAMVYLENRNQSLLFGGQAKNLSMLGDTWLYSKRQWHRIQTGAVRPSPRCGHSLAFDESAGVAVLFGGIDPDDNPLGDTWIFTGATWTRIRVAGPPARRYAAFAYDPELGGCLLHGGCEDDNGRNPYGDAWLFQDNSWYRMPHSFETDPRDDHGLAYHRGIKRLLMLEGVAGERGVLVRDQKGWRHLDIEPIHPRHQCSPLVWDDELGGLLMHGGEVCHGGPQFDMTLLLRLPNSQ
jgi:hypothetical protein